MTTPADSWPMYAATLAHALRERLRIIGDHAWRDRDAAGHLEALKAVSLEIAALAERLPPGAPPKLRHYLVQASYQKALDLAESASPA